jgi:hypothetical protein
VKLIWDISVEVKEEGKSENIASAATQKQAEGKAHELYPGVHLDVERVRQTSSGGPCKWRKEN